MTAKGFDDCVVLLRLFNLLKKSNAKESLSEPLFGFELLGEVLLDPYGAFSVAYCQFTKPYKLCVISKFRHNVVEAARICAVEGCIEIGEEVECAEYLGMLLYDHIPRQPCLNSFAVRLSAPAALLFFRRVNGIRTSP